MGNEWSGDGEWLTPHVHMCTWATAVYKPRFRMTKRRKRKVDNLLLGYVEEGDNEVRPYTCLQPHPKPNPNPGRSLALTLV